MPREQIHILCSNIVQSIESDSLPNFFDALTSAENTQPTRKAMPSSTNHVVSEYDHQRILVLNTREAFSSPYESAHAMTAFLEYLGIQWLKMIEDWEPREALDNLVAAQLSSQVAPENHVW